MDPAPRIILTVSITRVAYYSHRLPLRLPLPLPRPLYLHGGGEITASMEDLHLQAPSSSSSSSSFFSCNENDRAASSSASYGDAPVLVCTLPDSYIASSVGPEFTEDGADVGLEPPEDMEEEEAAPETPSSNVAREDLGFRFVKRSRVSISGNLEETLEAETGKEGTFPDQSTETRKKSRGNCGLNEKERIGSGNRGNNSAVAAEKGCSREKSMEKRSVHGCRKLPFSISKLPSEEEESSSSGSEIIIRPPPPGADPGYPNNLQEAIEMISGNFEKIDDKLDDMDILEIIAMKGVKFPNSNLKWWPPLGYPKP